MRERKALTPEAAMLASCGGGGGRVRPAETEPVQQCSDAALAWRADLYFTCSRGLLKVHWRDADRIWRLTFGPNGFNDLPNVVAIETSCLGDPQSAKWSVINAGSTDWLPPLTVQAVDASDAGRIVHTGGNHGASGTAEGARTAVNTLYAVQAGGQVLQDGVSGWGDSVAVQIDNELMAFNTISAARRVVRQSFRLDIRPGAVYIDARVTALERVVVLADNGPQMLTDGFQDSVLFHGGEHARAVFAPGLCSGPSSTYRAWAAEFQSAENGRQVSWVDRTFGAGDGRYVAPTRPFIRMGNRPKKVKCYHAVIASSRLSLAAGEEYRWRGGFAWQAGGAEWTVP